jgi:A/G-specific adenine glycosylase
MPSLASLLLPWYRDNARRLPWRGPLHRDAYAVWVSEIMLQQTRVETVIPYFEVWMRLFPTVQALSDAAESEVLLAWEGLGYYSRARNLHKAARVVAEHYRGVLPRDLGALRALPGIGRYTAGAIASIAYGMDQPALDGNLRRVYARLFDVVEPADTPAGEKILWRLAADHLPKGRAGDFNQALMDLGALTCLPKNPRCSACPLTQICKARRLGVQANRPVLEPKKATPHYVHAAGVILKNGRVLLAKRPSHGLLGGMWEFPNGRVNGDPARELRTALKTAYQLRVRRGAAFDIIRHAYTHFRVTLHAYKCGLVAMSDNKNLKWVRLKELERHPMGRIDRLIARKLAADGHN